MATTTETQPGRKVVGLSKEEILRYSRHLIMPEVGMEGQLKLKNAKVLLIGTGGLGAPLGLYLAAAGVGKLGLVDFDVVDFTIFSARSRLAPATSASLKARPPGRVFPISTRTFRFNPSKRN